MRRFLSVIVLCGLAHVAPAAELTPRPEGITRREALALPVQELANRLFGPSGDMVHEVMRPSYLPPALRNDPVLTDLKLATRPRALDTDGLCVAEVISITFEAPPASERKLGPQYERARPTSLKTSSVFKVASACDQAGRVLPTNSTSLSQRQYFDVQSAGTNQADAARLAVLVLQQSMNALAKYDKVAMDSLVRVSVAPCAARTCVTGEFLPSPERTTPTYWKVSVEADAAAANGIVKTLHKIDVAPVVVKRD